MQKTKSFVSMDGEKSAAGSVSGVSTGGPVEPDSTCIRENSSKVSICL
jgi:hypothetical protein